MSAQRKRSSEESSVIDRDAPCSDPPTKKRSVQNKTVEKWVVENDKELNTSVWLKSETAADDRDRVATLKCAVCSRFRERLQPMRNPFFFFFLRRRNLAGLASTHRLREHCHRWMPLLPLRLSASLKRRT